MKKTAGLRDFFTVFFKYKLSILVVWIMTVATIVVCNQLMLPTYEAESTVMVNFGREYLYVPETGKQVPYNYYNRSSLINAEIEILSSKDLIEQVINAVGIDRLYPLKNDSAVPFIVSLKQLMKKLQQQFLSRNTQNLSAQELRLSQAVTEFEKNLSILGSKESNIIRILFQHHDAETSSESVNQLVDLYQKKHLAMFRDERRSNFLGDMVNKYGAALKEVEEKLQAHKKLNSALAPAEEASILIHQRGDFNSLLKKTTIEEIGLSERLASLEKQMQSMSHSTPLFSETAERDRVIDNTKAELLSLKLKEKELLATYKESSSQVRNLRERIQLVEAFLEEQAATKQATVRVGRSLAYQELEREVAVTRADRRALSAKRDSIEKKLVTINQDLQDHLSSEQEMRVLVRQRKITEQNYLTYFEKLEEDKINAEMDNQILTNIRIVHSATPPYAPVKPKKLLNLVVGIILGAFGGIGLAFYRNFFNQGINTPEALERLVELPVLVTISQR